MGGRVLAGHNCSAIGPVRRSDDLLQLQDLREAETTRRRRQGGGECGT